MSVTINKNITTDGASFGSIPSTDDVSVVCDVQLGSPTRLEEYGLLRRLCGFLAGLLSDVRAIMGVLGGSCVRNAVLVDARRRVLRLVHLVDLDDGWGVLAMGGLVLEEESHGGDDGGQDGETERLELNERREASADSHQGGLKHHEQRQQLGYAVALPLAACRRNRQFSDTAWHQASSTMRNDAAATYGQNLTYLAANCNCLTLQAMCSLTEPTMLAWMGGILLHNYFVSHTVYMLESTAEFGH